ncbi:Zn-ribbon domain-containing OB-fold protein [Aeromicrobium sp. 9AM]|uniref:Zn-ribbon domain-containing OB-fold protein n=1 Tax=Aeromicrobium sp. 9AM TaxID=2653126 RepID=UPI0012F144C4|nr:OB-fold nucleic acid binding domain-containing protein [Aeromicrobium sp. 9AM]VXC26458.1 DNA-binding protein [Aeromicrobium sp. 9AM]
MTDVGTLHAPMKVEFDYTRSLGPTLSEFMTGLKRRQILGGTLSDGTVAVPPPEYDPHTYDPVTGLVPVSDEGVVQTWAWVPEPVPGQPLDRPFAFAQVVLDGADRPLLHAVAVDSADQIETGMRVRARWADETLGAITDIRWFEPLDDSPAMTPDAESGEPVTGIISPVHLAYDFAASPEESAFFRGLAEGRILGQRCPVCEKVYVPPRGACPVDGVPTTTVVEVPDTGIVTTFCIVNVPFLGQKITPPYVSAYMLLDGADIAFLHLLLGVDPADVRMGMRVKAVWKPRDEWGTTIENISHFEPTGEPDADFETYKVHL